MKCLGYAPLAPANAWEGLGCPRLTVAPMVDASELAWRLLSRRHGAQLCYTPMLHSSVFVHDANYRALGLATCQEDRPLVVQFCGNCPDTLVRAALLAQPYADAIDINLGCPQRIARRGHYGVFLQDEWQLLTEIVQKLRQTVSIPVSCKIRIYPDVSKTVEYAKMLEKAGCNLLTVHGRTRDQKGPLTGLASWTHIKAVKTAVKIPVIANGNIQTLSDVYRCIDSTQVDAVMSAEGNLYNPYIFEGIYPPAWEPADEYLNIVEKFPCPVSYTRGHLFKMLHHLMALPENAEERAMLAGRCKLDDFKKIVARLKEKYEKFHLGLEQWTGWPKDTYDLVLPPWLCKPYERPPPTDLNEVPKTPEIVKRSLADDSKEMLSKKKLKKLQKGVEKGCGRRRNNIQICTAEGCPNPLGGKCLSRLCKVCCRTRCNVIEADCLGHGILIKTRREKARQLNSLSVIK